MNHPTTTLLPIHYKKISSASLRNLEDKLQVAVSSEKKKALDESDIMNPGVFAHEIRNPLTNINLAVFMLKAEIRALDIDKYVEIINRSSIRINEIVNDFLHSFKNDHVESGYISVNQLLDEILEIAKDRIALKNISVKKNYTTSLCELLLDKPKITIALLNIIVNAIEAMPMEKGELKLTTSIHNGKCIVIIKDNGSGISKKNIKNIFNPYFTTKPNGMGIGLTATYNILASHQAGVKVESEEKKGSRFIISFNIS